MNSVSLQANSNQALQTELESLLQTDFKATVGFVFCSIAYDLNEIGQIFDQFEIDVVGATTAGEICNETVCDSSIVVLLLDMKKEHYTLNFQETGSRTTYQVAYGAGAAANETFASSAVILLSGGMMVDGDQVLYGFKDGIGKEVPMFGGIAGDDLGQNKTYVFTNDKITSEGLLCFFVDTDKVEVKGMAACGWEAIGGINTITSADGNILKSINDEPALDVFLRYFGFFDNVNQPNSKDQVGTISGQYPLQIMRENGYSVLRSPLIVNEENRSLILAGSVRQGDQFRFSIAPGFEVIEDTIKEFAPFKADNPQADALILFSCKGRHAALGPLVEQEVEGIYNYWNTPMVGFFTYGEFGHTKEGIGEFYNETCSLVMFREK